MLIAEGRVEAERSSRSLVRLCRHVDKAGPAHPQLRVHVEWSDRGVISFGWGRGTQRALPGVVTLRAEAPDMDPLRRVERPIADRLERIGCRDRLTVTWTRHRPPGRRQPRHPPDATEDTRGHANDRPAPPAQHR